jgi:Na+/H+ antiporter NhaD/arsenite permease-like protein
VLAAALIFSLTYLVIGLQRVPRLHIGRPAGAMLGAVAMVACGVLSFEEAKASLDLDTILFLLGMMIVLGYLELSGFFEVLERRIVGFATTPRALLLLVLGSSGVLSALFMNDTICLMLTPVVLRVTLRLGLPPVPYLVALATAANVGSACTIVGNPQNALIGVRSGIPLLRFTGALWPISALGLVAAALVLCVLYRREVGGARLAIPPPRQPQPVRPWLLVSALASGLGLVVALAGGAAPGAAAMAAGAAVILAGAARPSEALRRVDWSLLMLFGGLFVVMRGVEQAGLARAAVEGVAGMLEPGGPAVHARLAAAVTLLSQAVSNVPAVMLFVPTLHAMPPESAHGVWLALAAYSTLAGNLTILASVANLIVAEGARREGVEIGFVEYLKAGVPITLATLAIAWVWLA